jgi:NAD(P)H-nitrite reductase large subunit
MYQHYPYVIVGAGSASVSAVKAIRTIDQAPILIISNEDRLPYKRTQINKSMQEGFAKDEFAIFQPEFFQNNAIDIAFAEAKHIDVPNHAVILSDGNSVHFDKLLLATGHKPTTLNFSQIPHNNLFTIYTAQQAEQLRAHAMDHSCYFVLGGGVEGIEMAHQLHAMGKKVTVIHRSEYLMNKELSIRAAERLRTLVLNNGITLLHCPNIAEDLFTHNGSKVCFTHQNTPLMADAIVSCIGSTPNTDLAKRSGIKTNKGILADNNFRTSIPAIFAAGNAAELPNDPDCHLWHHAEKQGWHAGLNMAGEPANYEPKPFRLKADVFGDHYFSANYPKAVDADEIIREEAGHVYRELYFKHNKIHAIVMAGDKPRAKLYQIAIWEGWGKEEFSKNLPL